MVEVRPMPPGFHPINSDTLSFETQDRPMVPPAEIEAPAAVPPAGPPPHPLAAWADPGPPGEPQIRWPSPTGGYLPATKTALANLAAGLERDRQLGGNVIVHASVREAERHAREVEAERQRKASNPRGVLRQAHHLRAEAQAEVDRLTPLVLRARELVADLSQRLADARAAIAQQQTAAVARLTSALAAGAAGDALPTAGKADSLEAAASAVAIRLKIAEEAARQLGADKMVADKMAADNRLERTRAGVQRCAIGVLVDQAADEANEIIEADDALNQRRADLAGLAQLLTGETRRLDGRAPMLPAVISRALYPADRQLAGPRPVTPHDWSSAYAALCEDPGFVDRLADSAAAEAP